MAVEAAEDNPALRGQTRTARLGQRPKARVAMQRRFAVRIEKDDKGDEKREHHAGGDGAVFQREFGDALVLGIDIKMLVGERKAVVEGDRRKLLVSQDGDFPS